MEAILRSQLNRRYSLLEDVITRTKEIMDRCSTTGASESELLKCKLEVTEGTEHLDKEIKFYLERTKEPSAELVESCSRMLVTGETTRRELDVLQHFAGKNTTTQSKLPKLEMVKFSGELLQFSEFWTRFETTVDAKNISGAEKMAYLLGLVEGDARESLQGLQATNENYEIAIQILKRRYGSRSLQVDAHYDALMNMQPANDSAAMCRFNLNTIEKHLRVLESLGQDVNSGHLRACITNKFPDKVLYQLNLLTPIERDVSTLREGLHTIVTALERSDKKKLAPEEPKTATTASLHTSATRKRTRVTDSSKANKRPRRECAFCGGEHYSDTCRKFSTLQERRRRLTGRCYSCLRKGHVSKECRSRVRCFRCKQKHNTALCPTPGKPTNEATNKETSTAGDTVLQVPHSSIPLLDQVKTLASNNAISFLQTAVAKIRKNQRVIPGRILLDSGSQRSYLVTRTMTKLGIRPTEEDRLMVYTFGSEAPQEISSPSVDIIIETKRGIKREVRVNVIPHITKHVPINSWNTSTIKEIDFLADDDSLGGSVDLLIGNDYYFSFMRKEHIQITENLFLINSDFGWMVTGNVDSEAEDDALNVVTYCQCHGSTCPYFTEPDLPLRNIDMKFLWSLESIGITDSPKSTREEEVVKHFNETTKYEGGRYLVKWPWIQYPPELPTNFGLAYGRLKNLLQRSKGDILKEYNEIIHEQISAQVIEVVEQQSIPSEQVNPPIHYLPHHIVLQKGKKGRIVYDASAKLKDQRSLNECLYRGPSMLEDLIGLLLKFRSHAIGITADVEKAFLQVGLQDEDKDVTRFLWLKEIHKGLSEDNLLHLRFCRVPFGIISSPFLLTATIRNHIARTNGHLMKDIADKCYMDNLLTGAPSFEKAVGLFHDTQKVFKELSMNIREWMSNDYDFMKTIPEVQRSKQVDKCKVLGLLWSVKEDILELNLNDEIFEEQNVVKNNTKRDVLRTLARVFDPHGFAAPLVLPIKMLFQDLCTMKLKWDKVLPEELLQRWKEVLQRLRAIKGIQVPRYLEQGELDSDKRYELHTFVDASKNAYASVTYLRIVGQEEIKVSFVMSKARITPAEDKDDLKIPRLELLACLIGSRLSKYVEENIEMQIDKKVIHSDSQIVLSWLKTSKLLPPFVARRIAEIKQNRDLEFRYINTNENPADLATRPDLWEQKKNLWFTGPTFLTTDEKLWPVNRHIDEQQTSLFVGEALDYVDGPEMTTKGYETDVPDYFSEEQVTCGLEEEKMDENVTVIKKIQEEYFPDEISGKTTSLSRNLNLFMDVEGVLRCKGRMSHTDWAYDAKYPILIPRNSSFTLNLIKSIHEKNYHVGVSHTLGLIRQKYWIPQGKAQVQKILKKCPQCVKHGGGPYTLPAPPALPVERVKYSRPFSYTGIDYFGPLFVETDSGREKRWVCLFTCLAVRAVHLEVVKDLTAEECLLAIRRFAATRNIPTKIISDNALYFKLTSEVLAAPYCKESQIRWQFIPQLAPWHGGFYERLVGLVKNCLKRTLDKHLLRDSQLATIMKEVEAVVNTRPLTTVGADLEYVLRPTDFLSAGKCIEMAPAENRSDIGGTVTKVDLIQSWRRGQTIMEEFKRMFLHQYLPSLREKHRYSLKQPRIRADREPQVGDVVQLKDDSKNRINWKVGRITSLLKGSDGQYRTAKVRVGSTELTRSIGHLYPLEADEEERAASSEEPRRSQLELQPVTEMQPMEVEELEVDAPNESTATDDRASGLAEIAVGLPQNPLTTAEAEEEVSPEHSDGQQLGSDLNPIVEMEEDEGPELQDTVAESLSERDRPLRSAAVRAREKIYEWTRQLVALLQTSLSSGSVAELRELHD